MNAKVLASLVACAFLAACGSSAPAPASPSAAPAATNASHAAPASGQPSTGASGKPAAGASSKPSAAAAASGLTKIKVSYGELVPQSVPEFLAQDAGIYQKNGLDVDLQLIVSSAEIPALVSGEVQLGSAAGSQVMDAVAAGADFEVTAAIAGLSPFALYVQKSINTIQDLKGKAVGISKFG